MLVRVTAEAQTFADFPEFGRPGPSDPFRVRKQDGTWAWYVVHSRGTADGLTAAVLRDVTLEREVQESLVDMAHTDPLTGLANRRGLAQRTGEIWSRYCAITL